MSLHFKAIDPNAFNRYRQAYEGWLKETALPMIHTTTRAYFHGMAVVVNKRVGHHKDVGDVRDRWVTIMAVGSYRGGAVVLLALGIQLQHEPGDVIFFRSAVLEHFVAPFERDRAAVVLFTKNDLFAGCAT